MAKKSDKKTTIILLIVLALSVIGGGVWTYNTLQPLPTPEGFIEPEEEKSNLAGLSLNTVYQIKDDIIDNIEDFMGYNAEGDNIWDDFYTDRQFNRLNDIDLEIDIDNYRNNPNPFVIPSSTEEEI